MTRLAIAAALVAAFGVFFSVMPAKTAPRAPIVWDQSQPSTPQSAQIHTLVGSSFHAIHAGF
jgi:hypothetical protein